MKQQPQKNAILHWGITSGLLMFSFVTLSGIVFRLDPFAIVQRALCSAAIACVVAQCVGRAMVLTMYKKRKTWQR